MAHCSWQAARKGPAAAPKPNKIAGDKLPGNAATHALTDQQKTVSKPAPALQSRSGGVQSKVHHPAKRGAAGQPAGKDANLHRADPTNLDAGAKAGASRERQVVAPQQSRGQTARLGSRQEAEASQQSQEAADADGSREAGKGAKAPSAPGKRAAPQGTGAAHSHEQLQSAGRSQQHVVVFSNGATKEDLPNGASITRFANGDIKQAAPNGRWLQI